MKVFLVEDEFVVREVPPDKKELPRTKIIILSGHEEYFYPSFPLNKLNFLF